MTGRAGTLVRVPSNDPVPIKLALDLGCDGVIVPQVRTPDEARRAVAAAKYPLAGVRSVGIARAHRHGMTLAESVQMANDRVAVVQLEHADAVANAADILAVPGIDAVIVGPYDLSASLGRPGQLDHPEVTAAVDALVDACNDRRMPWGVFAANGRTARAYQTRGATVLALGTDTIYLWTGVRAALAELRPGPGN